MMTFLLANWRTVFSIIVSAGAFAFGWFNGSDHVQRRWDIDIHVRTIAQLEAVEKNQKLLVALQETKNENTKVVDQLAVVSSAIRVRMPKATCPTTYAAASGVEVAAPASGTLPDRGQQSLDEAKQRLDELFLEADKLTEQCRPTVDWANAMKNHAK